MRSPKNRHLVDVRQVEQLPSCVLVEGVLVPTPAELICQKLLSIVNRPQTPKGMMDGADLRRLLIAFPELKVADGIVADTLRSTGAPEKAVETWCDWVAQEILPEDDEEGF